ncbi:MAG: hypothetical protein KC940_18765 [Candidatus Omnitrophica bacterium]|nr:hypothetical protein [Candidatus Omnitrophota bacterium]
MYSYANRQRQRETGSRRRDEWREESSELQNKLRLRREQYTIDFSQLDRATGQMQTLLDRNEDLYERLGVLQDLITNFRVVIQKAEEKNADTYTLRQKLMSLERRAINIYREISRHSRAPEFDIQALRKLLKDYESMRN